MYAALFLPALLTIAAPRQEFKLTREEKAALKALEPFGFKVEKLSLQVNGVETLPYGTVLAYQPLINYDQSQGKTIYAPKPTAKDLAPLAKLTRLRRILFYAAPIVNDTMIDLLRNMSHLQYLDLRETKITDEGLKKLAGLRRLRTLHLDETDITDVGLKAFAEHPSLLSLSLSKTGVTDRGLEALEKTEQLGFLNLVGNKGIGDGCISSLGKMPNLETVYLNDTGVTDAGLAQMAKSNTFPKLYWIVLSDTAITGKGLKILHDPKVLPSLKRITLVGTKVTEEDIEALEKARRKLEVGVPSAYGTRRLFRK